MKQGFAQLALIALILILFTSGLAVFLITKNKTLQNPTPLPTEVSMKEGTPSSAKTSVKEDDPTANWKTYSNTLYGFEFKYPSSMYVRQEEGFSNYETTLSKVRTKEVSRFFIDLALYDDNFISIFEKPTTMNLDEWINSFYINPTEGGSTILGNTSISGQKAIKTSVFEIDNSVESTLFEHSNFIYDLRCPERNPNVDQIKYDESKILCNKILSTFKFTQ